jgi:RND family efflux transporter MFP subunit
MRHNRVTVRSPVALLVLSLFPFGVYACSAPEGAAAGNDDSDEAVTARAVTAVAVVEQPLIRAVTVSGTLAAEDQVALAFKVPGRVAEVRVDLGSVVREGDVVATLAPTDFDLRVRQAEAALVQARVRLGLSPDGEDDAVVPENTALVRQRRAMTNEAQLNRDRMTTFVERGLSPRASLESAEAALEVAEGQYQDALEEIRNRQGILAQRRSELEIARQQRQDTVLRAPLNGAVRERQVTVGEYRAAGTPVLTIVRTHPLRLQLAVPERDIPGLKPGLTVKVQVEGHGGEYDGRVARIGAAIDESNRTLPVEAVVPNPDSALRPGQFATARIIVSDTDTALVIPPDAIVTFAGVEKVLTVEGGLAHEKRIRTGRREGDRVEVTEGLSGGEMVIRNPGDLVDGVPVRVRTE